jgi:hypothetical protein
VTYARSEAVLSLDALRDCLTDRSGADQDESLQAGSD